MWTLMEVSHEDHGDLSFAKPHHLLWALLFLKRYGTEAEMAKLVGTDGKAVDEQTFRKWSSLFVSELALLVDRVVSNMFSVHLTLPIGSFVTQSALPFLSCQIVWENRKKGDVGNDCLISVDGTDVEIPYQDHGCPEAWFTKKFCGHGLRYEIGICILTGWIVWLMGPFPCGDWPDIVCFRYALKHMLDENERVEADDGYIGEDPAKAKVPGSAVHEHDRVQLCSRGIVRRRHETVNKRIKQFNVVGKGTIFRHDLSFHADCFRACVVLTQLAFENGHPPFPTDDYRDPA
jgi:hypothetical protein